MVGSTQLKEKVRSRPRGPARRIKRLQLRSQLSVRQFDGPSADHVVVVRIACDEACSVDAVLSKAGEAGSDSKAAAVVSSERVSAWLDSGSQRFWGKFGEVFGELTDFAEEDKKAAAAAVANAIGGMGSIAT